MSPNPNWVKISKLNFCFSFDFGHGWNSYHPYICPTHGFLIQYCPQFSQEHGINIWLHQCFAIALYKCFELIEILGCNSRKPSELLIEVVLQPLLRLLPDSRSKIMVIAGSLKFDILLLQPFVAKMVECPCSLPILICLLFDSCVRVQFDAP